MLIYAKCRKLLKHKRVQGQKHHFQYHHSEIIIVNIFAYIYMFLVTFIATFLYIPQSGTYFTYLYAPLFLKPIL